jgi:hypothetical protein
MQRLLWVHRRDAEVRQEFLILGVFNNECQKSVIPNGVRNLKMCPSLDGLREF